MIFNIHGSKELFDKWVDQSKFVQSTGMFIRTHCGAIVQNDVELNLNDLQEFKNMCKQAIASLERAQENIKNLYTDTITFITDQKES
jgi:hypothetical protein